MGLKKPLPNEAVAMTFPSSRWYLIHCKPRQDQRALENLERQAYQCYQPTRMVERLRHRRKQRILEPLFPGYIFIRLNGVNDNWQPICSTRGVNQIVRFNEHPLIVQDEIIDQIRAKSDRAAAGEPYLRSGERVRIVGGAFSQIEATFVADDGDDRVVLLLNILQSEHALSFPLRNVRKCSGT
jgi:transcriptional antiterminator RfaH